MVVLPFYFFYPHWRFLIRNAHCRTMPETCLFKEEQKWYNSIAVSG